MAADVLIESSQWLHRGKSLFVGIFVNCGCYTGVTWLFQQQNLRSLRETEIQDGGNVCFDWALHHVFWQTAKTLPGDVKQFRAGLAYLVHDFCGGSFLRSKTCLWFTNQERDPDL